MKDDLMGLIVHEKWLAAELHCTAWESLQGIPAVLDMLTPVGQWCQHVTAQRESLTGRAVFRVKGWQRCMFGAQACLNSFGPIQKGDIGKVEKVQRSAARFMKNDNDRTT